MHPSYFNFVQILSVSGRMERKGHAEHIQIQTKIKTKESCGYLRLALLAAVEAVRLRSQKRGVFYSFFFKRLIFFLGNVRIELHEQQTTREPELRMRLGLIALTTFMYSVTAAWRLGLGPGGGGLGPGGGGLGPGGGGSYRPSEARHAP